jgi:hypothetical protein
MDVAFEIVTGFSLCKVRAMKPENGNVGLG